MIYVGIDPGKKGGIVGLKSNGDILFKHIMPMQDKIVYTPELVTYFMYPAQIKIMIEEPIAMPKQNVKATFTVALNYGAILGALECECYEYETVHPRTWQAEMFQGVEGDNSKEKALTVAKRLWADVDFRASSRCKKAHDGVVDAALIAEYYRRQNDN